jgi:hypothetical protein
VALVGVRDPAAGGAAAPGEGPVPSKPGPVEEIEVVALQLRPLHPPIAGHPVQDLHELEPGGGVDRALGRGIELRVREHDAVADERRERLEVVGREQVVRRQVGDERGRGRGQAVVEGHPEAAVAGPAQQPDARVPEHGRDRRGGVVGRAVVDDDELPVGQRLGPEAPHSAAKERRLGVGRHEHGHARRHGSPRP